MPSGRTSVSSQVEQLQLQLDELSAAFGQLKVHNAELKLRQEVLEQLCRVNHLALHVMQRVGHILCAEVTPKRSQDHAAAAISVAEQQIQQFLDESSPFSAAAVDAARLEQAELHPPRLDGPSAAANLLDGNCLSVLQYGLLLLLHSPQAFAQLERVPDGYLELLAEGREIMRQWLAIINRCQTCPEAAPASAAPTQGEAVAGVGAPDSLAAAGQFRQQYSRQAAEAGAAPVDSTSLGSEQQQQLATCLPTWDPADAVSGERSGTAWQPGQQLMQQASCSSSNSEQQQRPRQQQGQTGVPCLAMDDCRKRYASDLPTAKAALAARCLRCVGHMACIHLMDPGIPYTIVLRSFELLGYPSKDHMQAVLDAVQLSPAQFEAIAAARRLHQDILMPLVQAGEEAQQQVAAVLLLLQQHQQRVQQQPAGSAVGSVGHTGAATITSPLGMATSQAPHQAAAGPSRFNTSLDAAAAVPSPTGHRAAAGTDRSNSAAAAALQQRPLLSAAALQPCRFEQLPLGTSSATLAELYGLLKESAQRLSTLHRTLGWLEGLQDFHTMGILTFEQLAKMIVHFAPWPILTRRLAEFAALQYEAQVGQAPSGDVTAAAAARSTGSQRQRMLLRGGLGGHAIHSSSRSSGVSVGGRSSRRPCWSYTRQQIQQQQAKAAAAAAAAGRQPPSLAGDIWYNCVDTEELSDTESQTGPRPQSQPPVQEPHSQPQQQQLPPVEQPPPQQQQQRQQQRPAGGCLLTATLAELHPTLQCGWVDAAGGAAAWTGHAGTAAAAAAQQQQAAADRCGLGVFGVSQLHDKPGFSACAATMPTAPVNQGAAAELLQPGLMAAGLQAAGPSSPAQQLQQQGAQHPANSDEQLLMLLEAAVVADAATADTATGPAGGPGGLPLPRHTHVAPTGAGSAAGAPPPASVPCAGGGVPTAPDAAALHALLQQLAAPSATRPRSAATQAHGLEELLQVCQLVLDQPGGGPGSQDPATLELLDQLLDSLLQQELDALQHQPPAG